MLLLQIAEKIWRITERKQIMKTFENKDTGLITALDLKQHHVRIGYWIMFFFLTVISITVLFPAVWIMLSSFKDVKEFLSVPPTLFPHSFHPEKVVKVWNKMNIGRYYVNTFIVSLGDMAFAIGINGLAGFVISRLKPKGANLFFILVLWSMMLPSAVSLVPLFITFMDFPVLHLNLMNTYWPMWLLKGANAFNVLLFKSFFDSISISYIEAARIDGSSDLGIFARIIIPLSRPVVTTVAIFSFNNSWSEFLWPYLIIKDKSLFTVPVQIFRMKTSGFMMDEYVIVLFLAMIPCTIMFILFQKQIMHGVSLGGIKG